MPSRDLRYPLVLLDVGETLIGPRRSYGSVYAGVLARLGIERTAESFERALQSTWREFDARIPPGIDRYREFDGGEDEYWTRFADHTLRRVLDGQATPDLVERALPALRDAFVTTEAWHVYPEVPAVLDALEAAGARRVVVSNWDSRLPALLDRLDLHARFEHVIVSHLEGVEKPDPRLFEIALERAGARAEDALHVGDRADLDLAGARAAGIAGVVVDRKGRHEGEPWAIPDLSALPAIARGERPVEQTDRRRR
jgi:putative hydrolase of the HAD superfamily